MTIAPGIVLDNNGTIDNSGTFTNNGIFNNNDSFNNLSGGIINNNAAFNNGGITNNSGIFHNNTIGAVSNFGIFNNSGTFNSNGIMINFTEFINSCDGVVILTGPIFGNAVIQESCDTTPPVITAALEPIDVEEDEGLFKIVFSASDLVDSNPTVTADINGIPVENGQIVELELDDETESEFDDEILEMEAPFFVLTVNSADSTGNESTVTISPIFEEEDDFKCS